MPMAGPVHWIAGGPAKLGLPNGGGVVSCADPLVMNNAKRPAMETAISRWPLIRQSRLSNGRNLYQTHSRNCLSFRKARYYRYSDRYCRQFESFSYDRHDRNIRNIC